MKKLMIAAAAVAMIGVAQAGDNPVVYNLKYSLKTLQPKVWKNACGENKSCTICSGSSSKTDVYYFETGSRKIEGLLASCDSCYDTLGGENTLFLLWDATKEIAITGKIDADDEMVADALSHDARTNPVRLFNDNPIDADIEVRTNDYARLQPITQINALEFGITNAALVADMYGAAQDGGYNGNLYGILTNETIGVTTVTNGYRHGEFDIAVFGKSFNKASVELSLWIPFDGMNEYTLNAVAFGTFDNNNKCVKSASGNVVGSVVLRDADGDLEYAYLATPMGMCDTLSYCDGTGVRQSSKAPAFGTFSMKKNASAAKKAIAKSVPSYMTVSF